MNIIYLNEVTGQHFINQTNCFGNQKWQQGMQLELRESIVKRIKITLLSRCLCLKKTN